MQRPVTERVADVVPSIRSSVVATMRTATLWNCPVGQVCTNARAAWGETHLATDPNAQNSKYGTTFANKPNIESCMAVCNRPLLASSDNGRLAEAFKRSNTFASSPNFRLFTSSFASLFCCPLGEFFRRMLFQVGALKASLVVNVKTNAAPSLKSSGLVF